MEGVRSRVGKQFESSLRSSGTKRFSPLLKHLSQLNQKAKVHKLLHEKPEWCVENVAVSGFTVSTF